MKKIILLLGWLIVSQLSIAQCITAPGGLTGGVVYLCEGTSITMDGSACGGGSWSIVSSPTGLCTISSGGVVTAGIGTGTATVAYGSSHYNVRIVTFQAASASSNAPICVGSPITLSAAPAYGASSEYLWIGPGGFTSTLQNPFINPSTISDAGMYSVTITPASGSGYSCIQTVTTTVSLLTIPDVGTLSGASVCVGSSISLIETPTGGIWNSDNMSIATIDPSSGVVTGSAAGTATISYTVTNSCGSNTATGVVTVNPLPSISGPSTMYTGDDVTLTGSPGGGTWAGSAEFYIDDPAVNEIEAISAGAGTVTYTGTNGCANTYDITVYPCPDAITADVNVLCVGGTLTLSEITAGGSWSSSNTSVATVSSGGVVSGVATGPATITYTLTGGCYQTFDLTIEVPDAGTISGASSVCAGSTVTLSAAIPGGTWSTGSTAIATISSGGLVTGVTAGSTTISYSITNSCGTLYSTRSVTVNPLPTISSGSTTICSGSSATLTATGGISYSWSPATGLSATTGASVATSPTITATYTITGTNANGCVNTGTATVTVINIPSVPSITGTFTVCPGANTTLSNSMGGGTWSSSTTTVATVSGSGVVRGVAAGNTTISYAVSNSCGTGYAAAAITVNASPNAGVISPSPVTLCGGQSLSLTSSGDGGGSWSVNNSNSTINASTGVVTGANFTGTSARTSVITYTVNNVCGSASATLTITIKANPSVSYNPSGSAHLCAGESIIITGTPSSGGYFSWSTSANMTVATTSANTAVVTAITAGTGSTVQYVFSGSTNVCATTAPAISYVVETKPTYAINGLSTLSTGGCAPNSATITLTVTPSGSSSTTLTWAWSPTTPTTYASLACSSSCGTNTVTAVASGGTETITFSAYGSYCHVPVTAIYTVNVVSCKPDPEGVGIVNPSADDIKIYPNPTEGILTIEIPPSLSASAIMVTDVSGRIIATRVSAKNKEEFDMGTYPRGMYFILVETEKEKYRKKLLLN